jgi:hypothetical protein
MFTLIRSTACLALALAFLIPATPVGAQTTCEYGAAMTPAQAATSAATGETPSSDGAPNASPFSGISNLFGGAAGGVVDAFGGDTSGIDEAMKEQREREAQVAAFTGALAAAAC